MSDPADGSPGARGLDDAAQLWKITSCTPVTAGYTMVQHVSVSNDWHGVEIQKDPVCTCMCVQVLRRRSWADISQSSALARKCLHAHQGPFYCPLDLWPRPWPIHHRDEPFISNPEVIYLPGVCGCLCLRVDVGVFVWLHFYTVYSWCRGTETVMAPTVTVTRIHTQSLYTHTEMLWVVEEPLVCSFRKMCYWNPSFMVVLGFTDDHTCTHTEDCLSFTAYKTWCV